MQSMHSRKSESSGQSSYRSIFKATSLFGGVQVYQIIIQIVRSKIVAILLGPAGVGITGLYQSGLQLIQNLTSLGLSSSAVRDVSEANGTCDTERIRKTVTVVKRLVWMTGLLGVAAVIIFSSFFSKTSFGNYDYTISFIILSITLLFDQLCAGQKVILQGLRRIGNLAKCSAIGVTFAFIISVPFYYIWGVNGIVPAILVNSIISFLVAFYFANKEKVRSVRITFKETLTQGHRMLVMGVSMSTSAILTSAIAYCVRGYIQSLSGVEMVGLYQAGFVIMNTYVGLIFNAISTDYYPRLAAINSDNIKCREIVSQQGEIATLILAPMLTVCLVFMPLFLQILYSEQFLDATDYITWACIGMMFRLSSWVISFLFVAKAEAKLFMFNEVSANIYNLLFSLIGFKFFGLKGIGMAFALIYFVYFLQVYLMAHMKYSFRFSISFYRCFLSQLLLVTSCFAVVVLLPGMERYIIGTVIIVMSAILGIRGLNKRLNLFHFK